MTRMLDNTNLSRDNYDATINGWAFLPKLESNVTLGAATLKYCLAEDALDLLLAEYNWTINGDSKDCTGYCFEDNTWIGPATGTWDTPTSWSRGSIPGTCDNVFIPTGKSVVVPSNVHAVCRKIKVEQGGTLTTDHNATMDCDPTD